MRHTEGRRMCAGTRKCQTSPKWLQKSQPISRGEKHPSPPSSSKVIGYSTYSYWSFLGPHTRNQRKLTSWPPPPKKKKNRIVRISVFWHQKYWILDHTIIRERPHKSIKLKACFILENRKKCHHRAHNAYQL